MLAAVLSLTVLGAVLGVVLGVANRFLQVEGNPLVDEVLEMMPGSNCGQCGFPGCAGAAAAVVDGSAPATLCPPGGKALASALAAKLGLSLDLSGMDDSGPKLAAVAEAITSASSHALPTSISRSCVLKMNMNGRMPVRMLYQNAVKPVSNGGDLAMPAAA